MSVRLLSLLFLTVGAVSAGCSLVHELHPVMPTFELYPVKPTLDNWTTSEISKKALPIDDETFRSVSILSNVTRRVLEAPDGVVSLEGFYPNGSYTFDHTPRGGFSFYAPGPESVDLATAREATFAYTILFPDGYEWVKGGKLPGFFGGSDFNNSLHCSGGRKATDCFSVRLMWRKNGMGEFYTYLPPFTIPGYEANEVQCSVPPYSECNPDYGNSIGRGAFNFTSGERGTVVMRVLLNDAGEANGELELWYNGESVISLGGLIIRDSDEGRLRGLMMQTFFGGSDDTWASPEDQCVYFSDFSVAITKRLDECDCSVENGTQVDAQIDKRGPGDHGRKKRLGSHY